MDRTDLFGQSEVPRYSARGLTILSPHVQHASGDLTFRKVCSTHEQAAVERGAAPAHRRHTFSICTGGELSLVSFDVLALKSKPETVIFRGLALRRFRPTSCCAVTALAEGYRALVQGSPRIRCNNTRPRLEYTRNNDFLELPAER